MRGGGEDESPPPLAICPPPQAAHRELPTRSDGAGGEDEDESPPPLMCAQEQQQERRYGDDDEEEEDVKPPPRPPQPAGGAGWEGEGQEHVEEEGGGEGFVPYGPRAGRDLVDRQTSGYDVRPHEKPPPLYQATLGLRSTYRHVGERRGKVRPRGGWAGTATGETRLFTSEDGTLRLGPHLPLLMGRYRFLRLLGQGTFAQIVGAEDTYHPGRRQVAIKVLNFHYGEVGKREALCLRVAHEAAGGGHAAIVRLLAAFDFMGHFCLVLELCQGGSLQAFVRPLHAGPPQHAAGAGVGAGAAGASPIPAAIAAMPTLPTAKGPEAGGGLPLPQLREVALHLVKALLLLHNHDVIHADLKPENVLLLAPPPPPSNMLLKGGSSSSSLGGSLGSSSGSGGGGSSGNRSRSSSIGAGAGAGIGGGGLGALVRLTDLGNAIKSREVRLYKEDYEIQTLGYRAPEVLLGGCGGAAFDHRIDMWSLGVLLVELHLGRPLFRAASKTLLVKRILSVLGPLPARAFVTGKYYAALFGADHRLRPEALALPDDPLHAATALVDPATVRNAFRYDPGAHHRLVCDLLRTRDRDLIGFIAGLLQLDPAARLTSLQALMHPFLTPCFPFALLRPHLGPAALAGMREQQRRQLQGDGEGGKAVIRPGNLYGPPPPPPPRAHAVKVEEEEEECGTVKKQERGSGVAAAAAAELAPPDSDGAQPTPGSTPALSLAPESPPRPSDEDDDEEEEDEEDDMAAVPKRSPPPQRQRYKLPRKRPREGEEEDEAANGRSRGTKPAPPAAAASPAKRRPQSSPGATKGKPAPTSARKWWEGEEDDEDDEDEDTDQEQGAVAAAACRRGSLRSRNFGEEKAGDRRRALAQSRHGHGRSSLEAAAAGAGAGADESGEEIGADADEYSEDELIL